MLLSDFQFNDPRNLLLALVCLPLALAAYRWAARARKRLILFSGKSRDANAKITQANHLDRATWFFFLALVCFAFALARPQANPEIEEREGQALDIIVMLDVSKSMAAEDAYPSRLGKAKRAVNAMLSQLAGDRVGLVAFAGSAVLISPLTNDYDIIRSFLFALSVDTIENQGTNIEAAISTAMEAFQRGSEREVNKNDKSHVLVALSDGEMNAGEIEGALKEAKKQGLIINTIAVGGDKGVPIPIRDKEGMLVSYKNDRRGNPVLTMVDTKSLENLASATGGNFYRSTVDDSEIADLVATMANLNRSTTKNIKARIYTEYFYIPLALGILFLILSYIPLLPFSLRRNSAILLICGALLSSFYAQAEEEATPNAPPSTTPLPTPTIKAEEQPGVLKKISSFLNSEEKNRSQAGIDHFSAGKYAEAADEFKNLQVDHPNSPELAYSTGTALLKEGKIQEGRNLLESVERAKQPSNFSTDSLSAFNVAGSYAEEKKFDKAIQGYASLIESLSAKKDRTPIEEKILQEAQKRIEHASKKEEEQQQQQQKKDQKQEDKDKKDDKKQEKGSDNQSKSQDSKSQDQKSEEKDKQNQNGEQDKKDEKEKQKERQQKYDFEHRKKFQENETLTEKDAKRILEALKQQEQILQKKFLQQKTISRQQPNTNDKDW